MNTNKNKISLSLLQTMFVASLFVFLSTSFAQDNNANLRQEIEVFQQEQNEHYLNKKTSPLSKKERKAFKGHKFYPIDLNLVVEAEFIYIEQEDTVVMGTSSGNVKYYRPYAKLKFKIGDQPCELTAYQSLRLRETVEYKDYLFVPFRDATSGNESYGGGRYIDLLIPSNATVTLNFNYAYNPYCAYADGYNCTIPPAENTLKVAVRAGLMAPEGH